MQVAFALVASDHRWFLESKLHVQAQAGHKDIKHDKEKKPGFSILELGGKALSCTRIAGSPFCVLSRRRKRKLANTQGIEEVNIPQIPIFIGRGYLKHAGGEGQGKYCLRYHICMTLEKVELKDNIAFAYGNDLSIAAKSDLEVVCGDSQVVVQICMINVRSEDAGHKQASVVPDKD